MERKKENETRFIGNIKEKGREHPAQMYLPVENNNRAALSHFYRASTRSSSANKKWAGPRSINQRGPRPVPLRSFSIKTYRAAP